MGYLGAARDLMRNKSALLHCILRERECCIVLAWSGVHLFLFQFYDGVLSSFSNVNIGTIQNLGGELGTLQNFQM